jgi:hypothetical protein
MPIAPRPRPHVVFDRTDLDQTTGRFYVTDVYRGAGMERVPHGTIKSLRIVEAPPKVEWTKTFWSIDAAQAPAMNWNVTVNKRILGTVPVEADGSAYFEVPADRFLFFQALDENGMMIQSMRSGTLVRPGETIGCVGCHENRQTTAPSGPSGGSIAMRRGPSALEPWYGPARNFNYLTEVQPVFDRRCVSCHDYGKPAGVALNLANDAGLVFNTSYLDIRSKSPIRWQPSNAQPTIADKPLITAVDDGPPQVLPPYAWGSHRSRLIDVLRDDHYGVRLKREEFDRVATWIDLNAPYYGSYASAYPDNPFGRSPLTANELARLSKLTGVPLTKGRTGAEKHGSQVSFTRPQLSACLSQLEKLRKGNPNDPNYIEALSIIEDGRRRLAERPRADMAGFVPAEIDRERQHKAAMLTETEAQVRRAIVERSKHKP